MFKVNELIDSLPDETIQWIPNERDRKEAYRNILASGNRVELLRMIHAIYLERKQLEAVHKRLHMTDEHFLKDAEQALYGEFQHVLKILQEKVIPYIVSRIEKKKKI